ncbi:hypothetical protein [Paenarthrobacter sp. FR1]|uniref:hypothetical protein n=1 Tax=Paenarthrobacter sp. FR1 TaxID=3439548 RepID=UPI003DA5C81B
MNALLVLVLLIVTGTLSYVLGVRQGRRATPGGAPGPVQRDGGAYQAGYLAGHVAGWRDAEAKRQGSAAQPTPQVAPAPAPVNLPPNPAYIQSPVRLPAPPAAPAPFPAVAAQRPFVQPQQNVTRPQQPPMARETPEAAAARKAKRDQQNINITLYVASLLLVAAGALFVGTSLPELFRFVGIGFITVLFYVSGLVVHARVPRLRPAAIAFVGTGLALIPVTGLAMYNFVLHNGPAAWLLTSLLGTIAYAYTAVRLDNKVLAFLSLSFVVSTAWSGVAMLGGALAWYFTALIGVAIALTLGALLRPRWIPPLYVRPLMLLHPLVVPLVALAVTLTPHLLSKGEYALVMAMCGIYFAVMVFVPGTLYRIQHVYAARAALTLALLGLVWDITEDVSTVMLAAVICLGVQSIGVALGGEKLAPRLWLTDAVWCLGLQLVTSAILTVVLGLGRYQLPVEVPLYVAMLTAMVVGWKLGMGSEFAPAAVLGVALPVVGLLGSWPVSILLASSAVYWGLRATIQPSAHRQHLILAGRIALTLAAPAVAAGVFEGSQQRAVLSLVALVASAVVQQLVSAGLVRAGVRLVAPLSSVAGFGAAAVAGLLALTVFDHDAGHPMVASSVLLVLSAGVASGLLLPWQVEARGGPTVWRPTLGELLAPATAVVAGVVAAAVVSLTWGNVVLLVAVGYFCATALRIPASFHRQAYWWLSRASATVLAATAYADATNHGWHLRLAGEAPSVALVIVSAAALQLALPLLSGFRRRFPRASMIDSGVVVGVMAAASTVLTVASVTGEPVLRDGWQPGFAAVVTALAAVTCGVALRHHPAAWTFAPAAFGLLIALRMGNVRDVEILLGVFAAYSGFMATAVRGRVARGGYVLGVRGLIAVFIAVVVADVTASPAAVSMSMALVLVLQHVLTWILNSRKVDVAFQPTLVWVTLGAQLALPLVYVVAGDYDDGGRWVVLVELVLVLASAAVTSRALGARRSQYFGVAATGSMVMAAGPALTFPPGTWLHEPLLEKSQVPLVLLALAVAMMGARVVFQRRRMAGLSAGDHPDRWFWLVSSLAFIAAGGLLALDVSTALAGLAVLVLASTLFAASHLERLPRLYAAAAPSVLVGAAPAVEGLLGGLPAGVWSDYAPWLVGGVGTALAMYAIRILGGASIKEESWRRNAVAATAALALACSAAVGLVHDETSLLGFALVVATGVLVVAEIPYGKWLAGEIAGLLAMASLQRAMLFVDGAKPDWFWTAQWYVIAGAVIAGLRYMKRERSDGLLRLCLAAGALSLTSLGTILGGTTSQQLYVLVAHVVLLAAGLLLAERVFVWWGAAGVALSVMWALRSYAFAMLALVAVALIVLAVWRLNRKPPAATGLPAPGGDPSDAPSRSRDVIR